jgi:hypothetical protein
MKKADVKKLVPGLYVVLWKKKGQSLASVGVTSDGGRWLAPVNWVSPTVEQKHWRSVDSVLILESHHAR